MLQALPLILTTAIISVLVTIVCKKYIEPELPDKKIFIKIISYLPPLLVLAYIFFNYENNALNIYVICSCFLILSILIVRDVVSRFIK